MRERERERERGREGEEIDRERVCSMAYRNTLDRA